MSWGSAFHKLLVILTIVPALILCFVCYIAYYPIKALPFLDVLGIIVPLLITVNFIFFVLWIIIKKRYALIPISALILGFLSFGSIYRFQIFPKEVPDTSFTIFSYNVQGFKYWAGKEVSDKVGLGVLEFVNEQDPDIICFQEYTPVRPEVIADYPHRYYTPPGTGKTNQAILSKYPIIEGGSLNFPDSGNNAIYADVVYSQDTLRIYNVHLQSYWIYSFRSLIERNTGKDFLRRLQRTAGKHREQAGILLQHRESSPYPVIYCGDFNQPSYSPTYKLLAKDMSDSFREEGKGWGTTFKRNYIAARIDFILADDQVFEVLDHQNFDFNRSDHLPIMARLEYLSD